MNEASSELQHATKAVGEAGGHANLRRKPMQKNNQSETMCHRKHSHGPVTFTNINAVDCQNLLGIGGSWVVVETQELMRTTNGKQVSEHQYQIATKATKVEVT